MWTYVVAMCGFCFGSAIKRFILASPCREHPLVWEAVKKLAINLACYGEPCLPGRRIGDTQFAVPCVFPEPIAVPVVLAPPAVPPVVAASSGMGFNRRPIPGATAYVPAAFNDRKLRIEIFVQGELEEFLAVSSAAEISFDTLQWWREHQSQFPLLAQVVARLAFKISPCNLGAI